MALARANDESIATELRMLFTYPSAQRKLYPALVTEGQTAWHWAELVFARKMHLIVTVWWLEDEEDRCDRRFLFSSATDALQFVGVNVSNERVRIDLLHTCRETYALKLFRIRQIWFTEENYKYLTDDGQWLEEIVFTESSDDVARRCVFEDLE